MTELNKTYRFDKAVAAWTLVWSLCLLYVLLPLAVQAQEHLVLPFYNQKDGVAAVLVDDVEVTRQGTATLSLQMHFSLSGVRQPKGYVTELVPRLYTATDSIDFPAVRLLGRNAYYHEVRSTDAPDDEVMEMRDRKAYKSQSYAKQVPYQPWMQKAKVKFLVRTMNGCGDAKGFVEKACEVSGLQPIITTVVPPMQPVEANTAQRTQQLQGRAYISFRVNCTDIDPAYQNNARELERIHSSIDSLLQQKDVVMKHLYLKGFASPEGSYVGNVQLASGRVQSLKQYLMDSFGLDRDLISVDFEPEDWEGLRQYVERSDWKERDALLSIIDTDMDPDAKLWQISSRYPRRYRHMLDSVFIYLRHTDYRVDYVRAWQERLPGTHAVETGAPSTATAVRTDTTYLLPEGPAPELTQSRVRRYQPLLAVKTNLLFDLALCPNVELEIPFGRRGNWSRWSLMAEVWFPWWRVRQNPDGKLNPYYRSDQRPTKTAYELLTIGAELRYWMLPRCNGSRPWLSGAFIGIYGAGGKYDLGFDGEGNQGEFSSLGLSFGFSWPIGRHWNMEASLAAGYVGGPKVHYVNEFDDTHLIYRYHDNFRFIGPTKAKISLVYILGKKGGKR